MYKYINDAARQPEENDEKNAKGISDAWWLTKDEALVQIRLRRSDMQRVAALAA